jgi:hypothetical protein
MKRREFIALTGSAVAAWPLGSTGKSPGLPQCTTASSCVVGYLLGLGEESCSGGNS